jgi:hypothetical protein
MSNGQADCQRVANAIFPFVEKLLKEHGEFFPVGAAMAAGGEVVALGVELDDQNPSATDVAEYYRTIFVDGARDGEFRATVLLVNVVTVLQTGVRSDAIEAHMDAPGYSVVMTFPYRRSGGQLNYGDTFVHAATRQVFAPDVTAH